MDNIYDVIKIIRVSLIFVKFFKSFIIIDIMGLGVKDYCYKNQKKFLVYRDNKCQENLMQYDYRYLFFEIVIK